MFFLKLHTLELKRSIGLGFHQATQFQNFSKIANKKLPAKKETNNSPKLNFLRKQMPSSPSEYKSGINLSKTLSQAKGSFLLVEEGSNRPILSAEEVLKESKERNQYSEILVQLQKQNQGQNVSIFYKQNGGVVATRGAGAMIFQDPVFSRTGKKKPFLDVANNVAGIGHSHPLVTQAGVAELTNIQTNARFLHPKRTEYVSRLLTTLPPSLDTLYFTNSGSEANDLALRMAKQYAKKKNATYPSDVICLDVAYHGHTQAAVDISPYKWRQCTDGTNYHKENVHVVSMPDTFRGPYKGFNEKNGEKYAKEVEQVIDMLGGGVGAFIHESIMGCGGQIVMPPKYLDIVYEVIRKNGGLVIADEVQTGFGRSGKNFWMFEDYGVVPDIVTMGKPMGNGYPMAGVACKREVAEAFADSGIEYFNTYAGNSVACAIGWAVLEAIEQDDLQHNALEVGKFLADELYKLKTKYKSIGDVRGKGLFLGVEFIVRGTEKEDVIVPNGRLCKFVVDYMRYERIISSRDGPDGNVLKLKPPLVFNEIDVRRLINSLERAVKVAEESGKFDSL